MKNDRCSPLILGLVLAVFAAVLPCAAQEEHLHPPTEAVPQSLFGVVVHNAELESAWPPNHFGGVRLWDAGVTWWNIEYHGKGQFDFRRPDNIVSLAASHGA